MMNLERVRVLDHGDPELRQATSSAVAEFAPEMAQFKYLYSIGAEDVRHRHDHEVSTVFAEDKFRSLHAHGTNNSPIYGANANGAKHIPVYGTRIERKNGRLDEICVQKFPQHSKTVIQSWILQGKVLVEGKPVLKAGTRVSRAADISITAEVPKFVCRAGHKLEAAIEHFEYDVKGKVALDAGLSTGGFADCLLQHGATLVYGVDVGYGQVAEKIRKDSRVCVMERTDLRYLVELPQLVDVVTLDLVFISITLVMPAVLAVMKPNASLIALIKPQFEAGKSQVGCGGVVRDPEVHKEVVSRVTQSVESCGYKCEGWIESPLKGAEGNVEFLACFDRHSSRSVGSNAPG